MKTLFQGLTLLGVVIIAGIPNHAELHDWSIPLLLFVILAAIILTVLMGLIAYILPKHKKSAPSGGNRNEAHK